MTHTIKRLVLVGLFFPGIALAQQSQVFELKVNQQQLGILERGLVELPYKDVAGLLNELSRQVKEQQKEEKK